MSHTHNRNHINSTSNAKKVDSFSWSSKRDGLEAAACSGVAMV